MEEKDKPGTSGKHRWEGTLPFGGAAAGTFVGSKKLKGKKRIALEEMTYNKPASPGAEGLEETDETTETEPKPRSLYPYGLGLSGKWVYTKNQVHYLPQVTNKGIVQAAQEHSLDLRKLVTTLKQTGDERSSSSSWFHNPPHTWMRGFPSFHWLTAGSASCPDSSPPPKETSSTLETLESEDEMQSVCSTDGDDEVSVAEEKTEHPPSPTRAALTKTRLTQANSPPDAMFRDFTPVITADLDDETYRFQGSGPGLYRCSVTGLLFQMKGEGDVVYRTVPWNRRLLVQHHQKPAGPLFDITCLQQSVCQLHLPHCEIPSTGGCGFLSVAHVMDEGVDLITPDQITETHVVINITGFSAYGNVKDEDSPPDPVRALVLLFYRPPADPDPESQINVLLLPKNVCLQTVLHTRKKLFADESYIETTSACELNPLQDYALSTSPQDDGILVQPPVAKFDCENYDNYMPLFQVELDFILNRIKLSLKDLKTSDTVWERRVCLSTSRLNTSCEIQTSNESLRNIRGRFIEAVSEPVLKSLLDRLLEKQVITDSEKEEVDTKPSREDKARFVIDTVRRKGEAAGSEMIQSFCELDTYLCGQLGLR